MQVVSQGENQTVIIAMIAGENQNWDLNGICVSVLNLVHSRYLWGEWSCEVSWQC